MSQHTFTQGDAIRCEGLQKYYRTPPKFAVKDFWLGVPEGECFGFLGLNGAGKTTVLAMLVCALWVGSQRDLIRGGAAVWRSHSDERIRVPERSRHDVRACRLNLVTR